MNSGINALGQGNRANATIGRALNLIVRNVGGARPGELSRSTLGGPHKYTFCFAEDESDPEWEPLAVARGFPRGSNAITFFQGDGIQAFVDQRSRKAPELTRSLAMALLAVCHPKLCEFTNALLVLSPEHYGIFQGAGWDRQRIESELHMAMVRPGKDLVQGAQGVGEGIDPRRANEMVNKFWPDSLHCTRWRQSRFVFCHLRRLDRRPVSRSISACNHGNQIMTLLLRDPTAEIASTLRPRRSPLETLVGKCVALLDNRQNARR
jgi:hypothetical protein